MLCVKGLQNSQRMALLALLLFVVSCTGARIQSPLVQQKQERAKRYGPVALKDLGLEFETFQKKGTTGCWFLAALEGLRHKGHVKKWFTSNLIKVEEVKGRSSEYTYKWTTKKGSSGTFEEWGNQRGLWQQVLESIFVQNWHLDPSEAKQFQHKIQGRLGQGENRFEEIQTLLQLIDPAITVTQDVFYIRHGQQPQDVEDFVTKQQDGAALAWTLDKGGTHAIACTTDPYKDGKFFYAVTYNQQTQQEDDYKITGAECKSTNYKKNTCDSVWVYHVSER